MAAPPPTKSPLDRLTHALTSIGQPRVTAPPNPLDHTPTQLNTSEASSSPVRAGVSLSASASASAISAGASGLEQSCAPPAAHVPLAAQHVSLLSSSSPIPALPFTYAHAPLSASASRQQHPTHVDALPYEPYRQHPEPVLPSSISTRLTYDRDPRMASMRALATAAGAASAAVPEMASTQRAVSFPDRPDASGAAPSTFSVTSAALVPPTIGHSAPLVAPLAQQPAEARPVGTPGPTGLMALAPRSCDFSGFDGSVDSGSAESTSPHDSVLLHRLVSMQRERDMAIAAHAAVEGANIALRAERDASVLEDASMRGDASMWAPSTTRLRSGAACSAFTADADAQRQSRLPLPTSASIAPLPLLPPSSPGPPFPSQPLSMQLSPLPLQPSPTLPDGHLGDVYAALHLLVEAVPHWYTLDPFLASSAAAGIASLPVWSSAVQSAPKTPAALKARQQETSPAKRLGSLLDMLITHAGLVADQISEILRLLAIQFVTLLFADHYDNPSASSPRTQLIYATFTAGELQSAHSSTHHFLCGAIVDAMHSDRLLVSLREAERTFSPPGSLHPRDPACAENLLAHLLITLIRELLPPFEASPQIDFMTATALRPGMNLPQYVELVRQVATANVISARDSRLRIMEQVTAARTHPAVDTQVHNEASHHVTKLMRSDIPLSSFGNDIRAITAVGGFLSLPIIVPSVVRPALAFVAPPPMLPATPLRFSPPQPPTAFVPPALPAAPSAAPAVGPTAADPSAFFAPGNKPCFNLNVIYPLLFPDGSVPVPEFKGSRDCAVCTNLFGKELVTWTEGAARPEKDGNQKWAHDPWFCKLCGVACLNRRANGNTSFTEALCAGLPNKPATVMDFPAA